ncbi:McrB family protein [Hymenobacter endophyticus]|uniref:AAA family ATPase n=1 Tax=Hymenobacter endophyticus TaxID=3076335 RepID=A0ABU3TDZ6_9BACT|nr:AAA family ATPase [Hymenobacter endophyticus]MDU0369569.1 AAA family ATPase [Hymenobacter endophyticus]
MINLLQLHGRPIYKVSMGRFNKNLAGRQLLAKFQEKGWLVVNKFCPDNQGELFMTGIQNGDYVYACAGSFQLWGIYRIQGDWADLPAEFADLITDSANWIYRQAELIAAPVREDVTSLNKQLSWWAPSGYRTVALVNNLPRANNDLFEPYFNLKLVANTPQVDASWMSKQFPNPNIILYGPPGTGKTRSTLELAYEILMGQPAPNYIAAQQLFQQELGKRLDFVTFHQSFTYEDFVQGFRPQVINGQMVFEKSDGVFYRIAERARREWESHQELDPEEFPQADVDFIHTSPVVHADYSNSSVPFETVFQEFIAPLASPGGIITLPMKTPGYEFPVLSVDSKYITFRRGAHGHENKVQIALIRELYEGTRELTPSGPQVYYVYIVERLLELAHIHQGADGAASIPAIMAVSDQEDTPQLPSSLSTAISASSSANAPRNYVLIIDEINRANIARVFGELITLLEKDKRLGGANPLPVTLPSGEEGFTVPANLYLIGTMNTADRSLALLDIALRRRFEFRPLYPRYDLFAGMPDNRSTVLQKLNGEIVRLKSRDFQIGHAYFLDSKESLESIFNGKVIPLLYEYFLNDEPKVQALLQAAGVPAYLNASVGLRYGSNSSIR